MSQVLTGHYLINYYNRYGAKLQGVSSVAENLMSAKEKAEKYIKNIDIMPDLIRPVSYTIDRRIVNSLDKETIS